METAEDPPISKKPAPYPLVFMRFRPAWAYIDGIREFGRFFCETTFGTQELADRACVVIQETLENAVKYSSNSADSELELSIQSDLPVVDLYLWDAEAELSLSDNFVTLAGGGARRRIGFRGTPRRLSARSLAGRHTLRFA